MNSHRGIPTITLFVFIVLHVASSPPTEAKTFKTRTLERENPAAEAQIRIVQKKGWRLEMHTLQPGTRSQGYHGELYIRGERVLGKRGEQRDSPLGTLSWHGSEKERTHLWDTSGWVLEGADTIPRPAFKPVKDKETLKQELDAELDASQ
ncbi:MAG: hypothetical protein MI742_14770 [Desulfobacterales bacterium]|nr:hypothetical protein [Desulfobacterales bacterium]